MKVRSFSHLKTSLKGNRTLEMTKDVRDLKARYVMYLFSDGPWEYDFLLRILSLGRDRYWRQSVIRESGAGGRGKVVLDLACGTGLLSNAFADTGAEVVGVDITWNMLIRAKELVNRSSVELIQARAEALPLREGVFDAAVISLATRNVSSISETFTEMARCVARGRKVISMDFTKPSGAIFGPFYYFYIFRVLPALGLVISRHWNGIFVYLANSIRRSKSADQLQNTMSAIGLIDTMHEGMTHGVTALVSGRKGGS